jgi:DNA polymerase-4
MDAIRARFGRDAAGYARVMLSELGGVPEEFRELAEHDIRPPKGTD